jgi:hypothetical protein
LTLIISDVLQLYPFSLDYFESSLLHCSTQPCNLITEYYESLFAILLKEGIAKKDIPDSWFCAYFGKSDKHDQESDGSSQGLSDSSGPTDLQVENGHHMKEETVVADKQAADFYHKLWRNSQQAQSWEWRLLGCLFEVKEMVEVLRY